LLDLPELHFLKSEKGRHLDDLAWIHKVFRVGTEFLYSRTKLTAAHPFRNIERELTTTILHVMQAEFTNYHLPSITTFGPIERGLEQRSSVLPILFSGGTHAKRDCELDVGSGRQRERQSFAAR